MFHPDDETLAAVALGEETGLGEDQLEHVRSCAQCSATVASVRQTTQLVRSTSRSQPLVAPPAHVWSRIEAALDEPTSRPAEPPVGVIPPPPPESSPSASASVHSIQDAAARRTRRLPLGWAAGLAAAGLAIGLLTGRALWQEPTPPPAATIASAELDTLDTQQRLGEAALLRTDRGVDLRVSTTPLDPGDGYLEVWLINTDGKRMVSVGVLRGDAPETFPVSQALIDEGYVVVDISREGFDDRPEHSGDSVARGTLPA